MGHGIMGHTATESRSASSAVAVDKITVPIDYSRSGHILRLLRGLMLIIILSFDREPFRRRIVLVQTALR